MDPTDQACKVDNRSKLGPPSDSIEGVEWISPTINIKFGKGIKQSIHYESYKELADLKDQFEGSEFGPARDLANPYEGITNSIFSNRAGVKLANIDAVFHLTGEFDMVNQILDEPFTFADIAAGPGAFTQYIQWRNRRAFGYGMTLKHKTLDWDFNIIDKSRFQAEYGKGGQGDLYLESEGFVDLLRSKGGVDLVTSDGGFDLGGDKVKMREQEHISSRLFLSQVLVGVGATKTGGSFVVKVFDTVTLLSFQIIYLLTQTFSSVNIFKPVSSRPANAERYLVATGKYENGTVFDILTEVHRSYGKKLVESIFDDDLPKSFLKWIERQNKRSLDKQLKTSKLILEYMEKGLEKRPTDRLIQKVYALWAIPGGVPRKAKRHTVVREYNTISLCMSI